MLKIGDKIDVFSLDGVDALGNEKVFSLSDFAGKKFLLYFYPSDGTPGCTKEACDFRDNMNRIKNELGLQVVGVSPNNLADHKAFIKEFNLNFPLLSDVNKKLMLMFSVWGEKSNYGKIYQGVIRSTFLINERGCLEKAWKNVKATGHVDKLIKDITAG